MAPIMFWLLIVLVQGDGVRAFAHSTEAECKESKQAAYLDPNALLVSECVPIHLNGKA